jgi:hypothetical protein
VSDYVCDRCDFGPCFCEAMNDPPENNMCRSGATGQFYRKQKWEARDAL